MKYKIIETVWIASPNLHNSNEFIEPVECVIITKKDYEDLMNEMNEINTNKNTNDKIFMEDMTDIYAYMDGCNRLTNTIFEKFAMLNDILKWYTLEPMDIEAEEGVIYISPFPDGGMYRKDVEKIIELGFDFDEEWEMIVLYTNK